MFNSLADVLSRGFPGRQWTFAKGYEDLVFMDDGEHISMEDIEAMDLVLVAEDLKNKYKKDRQRVYPSIADQLDTLWHAMADGTLPMVPNFYEPLKLVKDKFPK